MNQPEFSIAQRLIGPGHPPYIIAELSANHHGSIDRAFRLIDEAKAAGADAIKIQTYRPDTITLDCDLPDFQIQQGLWAGRSLYELYEEAHTPWEWHAPLFEYAKAVGITLFSSPFDTTAIDLLEDLNTPAYKIASFEAIDLPLIRYAAGTGKPLIISTGMANEDEIQEAVEAAREGGATQIALLHCVSGYPAPPGDYHLNTLVDMQKRFEVITGLSDHTLGNTTAIAGIALGACLVEKHFTLDRQGNGPDDSFSLEPIELAQLCRDAKTTWGALGRVDYTRKPSERENLKFRRSLYFVADIPPGGLITASNTKSIRPGYGLHPKHLPQLLGKSVPGGALRGTPVTWDKVEA